MTPSIRRFVLSTYRFGLNFYPAEFREHNREEMLRCAAEMLGNSAPSIKAASLLADDLVRSLFVEYFAMSIARIPQLAILLTLTTFVAATAYLVAQQVVRMSANDPQIQLAEDAASRLDSGEDAALVVPDRHIDMASSLAPFVIVYDNSGRPITSSVSLDGKVPTPPRGVFDLVRSNREHSVTWQPRPDVRIASVITRSANGFVLAGRNMREVEFRVERIFKLAAAGWVAVNAVLLFLWFVTPLFSGGSRQSLRAVA